MHGDALSSPSTTLMPMQSTRFVLEQSAYGPDAFIRYTCGDEVDDSNIRFEVQQNHVLLFGSEPTLNVQYSSRLRIEFFSISSSGFSHTPGQLIANIFPK